MVYDPLQNCVDQVLNSSSTESAMCGHLASTNQRPESAVRSMTLWAIQDRHADALQPESAAAAEVHRRHEQRAPSVALQRRVREDELYQFRLTTRAGLFAYVVGSAPVIGR